MAVKPEIPKTVRAAHEDLLRIRDELEIIDRGLRSPVGRLAAVDQTLYILAVEFPAVAVDAALDRLIAKQGWTHAAQAILRPRPRLDAILHACDRRLNALENPPPRLLEVREALFQAIQLKEGARRRRQRRDATRRETAR